MTDTPPEPEWPEPLPDPAAEPGENAEGHLLPDLERLRALTPEQRDDLLDRVRDWEGPLVTQFRERVAALREGREP